jgi:hypothetical protein
LDTSFKFQFYTDAPRELVTSASLAVEWGHTGSADVGAEPFTTLTPTFFIGKGFGDLPETAQWIRPFAITGQVGSLGN